MAHLIGPFTFCGKCLFVLWCILLDHLRFVVSACLCYGASYWTIYVLWIFAVLLSLLLALAKHKESGDILITILSFFAFWATLFGLQSAPFYCYADSKAGSIVRTILRAVIDVMLTIIYLLWSKEEIMAIISK
ncbi:hypothetical protein ACHWQZ_G001154 [Mnemiopsis leidyi]